MKVHELLAITEAGTLVSIINDKRKVVTEDNKEEIINGEYKDREVNEIFPDTIECDRDFIPVLIVQIK